MNLTLAQTPKTIGQLVAERPERGRVFERLGIDYCCGGRKFLADACAARGLDPAQVQVELAAADAAPAPASDVDWSAASLSDLADHIEATHHQFMRQELPRALALVKKVATAHAERHPAMPKLLETFDAFSRELGAHMLTEEIVVFPWIRDLARPRTRTGTLNAEITAMMREHDGAGAALAAMRELTLGFTPPPGACGTYRVMLSTLREIEADMHTHVHKENNILFPRALAAQSASRTAT